MCYTIYHFSKTVETGDHIIDIKNEKLNDLKQYLSKEFCMDDDEITEMLEIFFESMEQLITKAESYIAESTPDLIVFIGHSIKGSAANINANAISKLGIALEDAAKENNLEQCSETVTALKTAMAELQSEYRT